jgi:hypothetical protein
VSRLFIVHLMVIWVSSLFVFTAVRIVSFFALPCHRSWRFFISPCYPSLPLTRSMYDELRAIRPCWQTSRRQPERRYRLHECGLWRPRAACVSAVGHGCGARRRVAVCLRSLIRLAVACGHLPAMRAWSARLDLPPFVIGRFRQQLQDRGTSFRATSLLPSR